MDMSRVENILRYILGEEATLPVPLSRVEDLLIELGRMIEEGKLVNPIVIKGRVDTLEDLYAVQNPEPGWLYFVGLETDTNLDEYVYSVDNTWDRVGTSTIAVDSALSAESENPVQNKVITVALNSKAASTDIKDGTLTITANGNTYTFSANSATNVTLDLGNIQSLIDQAHKLDADLVDDTNSTNKFVTAADITKLSGIETGAEVNQNAFSNVTVGSTTVAADSKTDTLTFVAGSNVTITPDTVNDTITIAATDTTYSEATTAVSGLMSSSDKTKLSGIETGAEVNQNAFSNVKIGSSTIEADAKTDTLEFIAGSNVTVTPDTVNDTITISATDTTYSVATPSSSGVGGTDGLLSATDKEKIDGFDSSIGAAFVYKGSVDNVDLLPASSNRNGDVYNVAYSYSVTVEEPADWSTNYTSYYTKSGNTYTAVTGGSAPTWAASTYYARSNNGGDYVWIGSSWDAMSGEFVIEPITNAEIDAMFS